MRSSILAGLRSETWNSAGLASTPSGRLTPHSRLWTQCSAKTLFCWSVTTLTTQVEVEANEDRLRQVLINLFANAIKYNTASAPELEVRSRRCGWMVLDRCYRQRRRCRSQGSERSFSTSLLAVIAVVTSKALGWDCRSAGQLCGHGRRFDG